MKYFFKITLAFFIFSTHSYAQTFWKNYYHGNSSSTFSYCWQTPQQDYIIVGLTPADTLKIQVIKIDIYGNVIWDKVIGVDSFKTWNGTGISTDDGGFIIAGSYDTVNYAFQNKLLVKFDSSGNISWSRRYNVTLGASPYYQTGFTPNVIRTFDKGYIFNTSDTSGVILVKTDSSGFVIWTKVYEVKDKRSGLNGIISQTRDSGLIFRMSYLTPGPINKFYPNSVLIKTDDTGNIQWSRTFRDTIAGSFNNQSGFSSGVEIYQTHADGYLFTQGKHLIHTNSIGDTIWTKAYYCDNDLPIQLYFSLCSNNDLILSRNALMPDPLSPNDTIEIAVLFRTDSSGNILWTRNLYNPVPHEELTFFYPKECHDGGFLLSGASAFLVYGCVLKTDSIGNDDCISDTTPQLEIKIPLFIFNDSIEVSTRSFIEDTLYLNVSSGVLTDDLCSTSAASEILYGQTINIYPNPTTGHCSIELPYKSSIAEVIIINTFGQEMSRTRYSNTSKLELEINSGNGLYFVRVLVGDKSGVYKVLKM